MSCTLDYGFCRIVRMCRCCRKIYKCNLYDPGAVFCPECRVKRYRKQGLSSVINDK